MPPNKLSILSINTWGDQFYQPLRMGHQNFLASAVPANFSIGLYYGRGILAHGGEGVGGSGTMKHCLLAPCDVFQPYLTMKN